MGKDKKEEELFFIEGLWWGSVEEYEKMKEVLSTFWMEATHELMFGNMKNKEIEERLKLVEQYKQEELYVLGYNSAQKEIKQKILDLKNKYKSHLQEETNCKIGKNINFVRETELKAKISTLIELEKKL